MTHHEDNTDEIEQRLRAVAPSIRPGVRERILHDCEERQRSSRRARQRRGLALRSTIAGILAFQCLTLLYLDRQSEALLDPAAQSPSAALVAEAPADSADFQHPNLQTRFRTLAVLLGNDDMNAIRPFKEASDVAPANRFPTPVASHSG